MLSSFAVTIQFFEVLIFLFLLQVGNSSHFKLSNMDKLKDHSLSIDNVDYTHRGKYYCCVKEFNVTKEEGVIEGCHEFILRVRGMSKGF